MQEKKGMHHRKHTPTTTTDKRHKRTVVFVFADGRDATSLTSGGGVVGTYAVCVVHRDVRTTMRTQSHAQRKKEDKKETTTMRTTVVVVAAFLLDERAAFDLDPRVAAGRRSMSSLLSCARARQRKDVVSQ